MPTISAVLIWLDANKVWVFSGVGVAGATVVVKLTSAVFQRRAPWHPALPASKIAVRMTGPPQGAAVRRECRVVGDVFPESAAVYVLVHPTEAKGHYYPQGRATVLGDGSWHATVYVGSEDANQGDQVFELMAVANPLCVLDDAVTLDSWPPSQGQSSVVRVRRAK
jgi:hypothetical protein